MLIDFRERVKEGEIEERKHRCEMKNINWLSLTQLWTKHAA